MTTTQLTHPSLKNKKQIQQDVLEVLKLIDSFSSLLSKETAALQKADFTTVSTLQPDKKNLAKLYHAAVTVMNGRREDMTGLDLPLREKLIRARTGFTAILSENMQAIEATKNSAQRLIDRILATARHTVIDERQTTYSPKGKTASYKSATNALSLDQIF